MLAHRAGKILRHHPLNHTILQMSKLRSRRVAAYLGPCLLLFYQTSQLVKHDYILDAGLKLFFFFFPQVWRRGPWEEGKRERGEKKWFFHLSFSASPVRPSRNVSSWKEGNLVEHSHPTRNRGPQRRRDLSRITLGDLGHT